MRVLVTGGAGFIGSHIVRALLQEGREVRILDNLSTGHYENIAQVADHAEFVNGDICDYDTVSRVMKGVEVVYHEAALPSVPRSVADPVASTFNNVVGTTTVLKAAVDAGVRRVVYAASSSAYGNSEAKVKAESLFPRPLSPYAVTKLAGEYMLQAFSNCYTLETVGLRYFNVFGERQDPNSQYSGVIAKFCKQMLRGERPTIYGDGRTSRDFTYVANVVDANLLAATAPTVISGSVMNVACGDNITLLDLVRHLNEILGTSLEPIHGPERAGDVKHSCADITRASALLGYVPRIGFAAGLRKTLEWYRQSLGTPAIS